MDALTVAALVLTASGPIRLASVGFSQIGLSGEQAAFYSEHFAVKLAEDPTFSVATTKDLGAIVGFERQKVLLGCSDATSSCMAELAGALGVDGVVTGQIARVGSSFQLSVKVLAADGSKLLFAHASELFSSEENLLEGVTRIATLAAAKLKERLRQPAVSPTLTIASEPSDGRPIWRLTPVAVGALALGVGAGLAADAAGKYGALKRSLDEGTPPADFPQQVASGRTEQTVAGVVGGVGLAAVVGGALWYFLGPTTPIVAAYGSGSGVGVSATWELR